MYVGTVGRLGGLSHMVRFLFLTDSSISETKRPPLEDGIWAFLIGAARDATVPTHILDMAKSEPDVTSP